MPVTSEAGVGQDAHADTAEDAPPPQRYVFSFFASYAATTCRREYLTLAAFGERCRTHSAASKQELEWVKMAEFGPDRTAKRSLRHDGNVVLISGLEADYDGEQLAFDAAVAIAVRGRLHCLIYTSPSHTAERPRWRVMAPFSQTYAPDRRTHFMGRLNGLFGGIFSVESWTLSQSYYFGPVGDGPFHRVWLVDGVHIDALPELDETWIGKPGTRGGKPGGQTADSTEAPRQQGHLDEEAMLSDIVYGKAFHEAKTRLAGLWARNGVPFLEARQRLHDAFDNASDAVKATKRWQDRRGDLDRTLEDIYGKQARRADAKDAQRAALEDDEPPAPDRASILVRTGRIDRLADMAETALLKAGTPVFVRGKELVRPVLQQVPAARGRLTVTPSLAPFSTASMLDLLSLTADWVRWDPRDRKEVPCNPPKLVAEILLTRLGRWRLRPISGVLSTPTLRPDGSLLDQPGYDFATRLVLMLDPALVLPATPERPTKAQAEAALKVLFGLIDEFPFVSKVDQAVAFSALITPIMSGAVPTAPMHAIDASAAGSGKSYLADIVSAMLSGRPIPVISLGGKPEELEARLTGALLSGYPVISIDNVNGELASDLLCQAIERPTVRLRRLGASDMFEIETRVFMLATGNGLRVRGDLTRRTLPCHLDARMERPERRQFEHRPVEEVLRERGKYVAAALTVVRGYIAAGQPGRLPTLNSFEAWSDYVRSALVWLGERDPADAIESAREDDPEALALADVLTNWQRALDEDIDAPRFLTCRGLVGLATKRCQSIMGEPTTEWRHSALRDALMGVAGVRGELHTYRLSQWLRSHLSRIVDGRRIVRGEHDPQSRAPTWSVG